MVVSIDYLIDCMIEKDAETDNALEQDEIFEGGNSCAASEMSFLMARYIRNRMNHLMRKEATAFSRQQTMIERELRLRRCWAQ